MSSAAKSYDEDRLTPVSDQEIAARAFQLWQERGCPQNDAEADWHNARTQLSSEHALRSAMQEVSQSRAEAPAKSKPSAKLAADKPSPPSSRRRVTFPKGHSPIY